MNNSSESDRKKISFREKLKKNEQGEKVENVKLKDLFNIFPTITHRLNDISIVVNDLSSRIKQIEVRDQITRQEITRLRKELLSYLCVGNAFISSSVLHTINKSYDNSVKKILDHKEELDNKLKLFTQKENEINIELETLKNQAYTTSEELIKLNQLQENIKRGQEELNREKEQLEINRNNLHQEKLNHIKELEEISTKKMLMEDNMKLQYEKLELEKEKLKLKTSKPDTEEY